MVFTRDDAVVAKAEGTVVELSALRRDAVARGLADQRAAADGGIDRLLRVAQELIRREGTVDLSLRELIDQAGVGTRFFYRHFEGKEAFLLVLLEDLFRSLSSALERAIADAPDARHAVIAWVGVMLDQADPEIAALGRPLLVQAARLNQQFPDAYRAVGQAILAPLADTIGTGVADGTLRSNNAAADARAAFFLALSVMQSHVMEGTTPSLQERADIAGFVLRALGADMPGASPHG